MREWTRAKSSTLCAGCGAQMLRGDPLLLIHLPGVEKPRRRCQACAGSEAPPDLPALVEKSRMTKPLSKLSVAIPGIVESLKKC
jgi:hypothetical protein